MEVDSVVEVAALEEVVAAADDEEEEYDDFDDDDDLSTEWNLRKCAAAAIDVIAVRYAHYPLV